MERRQLGCLAVAVVLVVGGTLATGVLPRTTAGQLVAGGIIVAGFAVLYYCFAGGD